MNFALLDFSQLLEADLKALALAVSASNKKRSAASAARKEKDDLSSDWDIVERHSDV